MPGRVLTEGLDLPAELTRAADVASYETPAGGRSAGRGGDRRRRLSRDPRAPARLGYLDAELAEGRSQPGGARTSRRASTRRPRALRGARAREPRRRRPARELRRRARRARNARRGATPSSAARSRSSPPTPRPTTTAARSSRSAATRRARRASTRRRSATPRTTSRRASALARLGGGARRRDEPKTANEKLAMALAEQAHQAALRDDYAGATQEARRSRAHRAALRARRPLPREHRLPPGRPRRRDQGAEAAPSSSSPTIRCFGPISNAWSRPVVHTWVQIPLATPFNHSGGVAQLVRAHGSYP